MMIWVIVFLAAWLVASFLLLGFLSTVSKADDRLSEVFRHRETTDLESVADAGHSASGGAPGPAGSDATTPPESTWGAPHEHPPPDRVDD